MTSFWRKGVAAELELPCSEQCKCGGTRAAIVPLLCCVQAEKFILLPLKSLVEHVCLVTSFTES